jgi:hypothetical protein
MNKLYRGLFALSLGIALTCAAPAPLKSQESMSRPRILQITREFTKPGKAGAVHNKAESAFVQAMTRAKWPTHYLGMTSLSGKQRALFFTWYDSMDAWQKDSDAIAKNATLSAELDRAGMNDGELLESMDQGVFMFNEGMSLRPKADLSHVRYLEILAFHVRPGHGKEWQDLVKMYKDGYEKAVPDAHWGVFEAMYGGDGGTYLVLIGRENLSEIDKGLADNKQFAAALGEDGMKKLAETEAACVESSQSQLFAINPHMSYVADDWVKADPDFWKPKAPAHMAKPAAEPKKPTP